MTCENLEAMFLCVLRMLHFCLKNNVMKMKTFLILESMLTGSLILLPGYAGGSCTALPMTIVKVS